MSVVALLLNLISIIFVTLHLDEAVVVLIKSLYVRTVLIGCLILLHYNSIVLVVDILLLMRNCFRLIDLDAFALWFIVSSTTYVLLSREV